MQLKTLVLPAPGDAMMLIPKTLWASSCLRLMAAMSEIHEAMWGTTQTGISKLDEDFHGYANLFFGRVRERFTDYRWEQWLKDVSA